jgi:UDP-N-acetyl-D-mannosaminuronate dehydrogenase
MNLNNRTIAVISLGYVGLPLAVEFGKKRPVIGFDIKANRPDMTPLIKASDAVIYESTVYPGATEEVCVPILKKDLDRHGSFAPSR